MQRLILLICVLLLMMPVYAQDDDADAIPTDLTASLDALDVTVQELRELEALESVARDFPTRAEVLDFITAMFEAELSSDVVIQETQFYRAFNFVDADFDLAGTYVDLMGDQVAGFYSTETQVMNVLLLSDETLTDSLPALERIIYVHEYVHALQDQHFDLDALLAIDEPDASLAALALVEGDATFVMQRYVLQAAQNDPGFADEVLNSDVVADAGMPQGVPGVLEEELLMPYLRGMFFVSTLWGRGGWEAINDAYADPPQTTEQILHPEKYLEREGAITVTINPVADVLDADWQLLYERTLGEFYLGQHMATLLDVREAETAAAGWGGDRYLLYYDAGSDQNAWVLRLAWDTPEDADEFAATYAEFAAGRAGVDNDAMTLVDGVECWQSEAVAVCMLATDGGDTFIATATDAVTAAAMIAMQE